MLEVENWNPVSVEEYLNSEEASPVKREFYEGLVFEMTDFTNRHNQISGNALGGFYAQLRGKPCKPCNSATKIRIRLITGTRFYYPLLYEGIDFDAEAAALRVMEEEAVYAS